MRKLIGCSLFLGAVLLLGACSPAPVKNAILAERNAPDGSTGFLNQRLYEGEDGFRYVLYVPHNYTSTEAWPLIVFLHGAGERGGDGLVQTEVGVGTAIRRYQDRFPCLVLFPQCPEDRFWDAVLPQVEASLARTREDYEVDSERIYLTGISMGGYATWMWGAARSDVFAALLPICGGGRLADIKLQFQVEREDLFLPFDEQVKRLATLPIYAYHGENDRVVPESRSRETAARVREAGGAVKYKALKDAGHECWDEVYESKRAIEWLLQQRKPAPAETP